VVTGAASGIGLAIAGRFVAEGVAVVLGDIDDDALDRAAQELGPLATALHCDVTSEGQVEALFETAVRAHGGIDVVVANAGRGTFGLLVDHSVEEWRSLVDLCLTGTFLTVKHAGRHLNDGGSLITIASLNAVQPAEGMGAYCAAKAGVAMLTKVAAMELGHRQIRVNTIAPGLVQTNATAPMWMVPGVVDDYVANTTIGRFGQPEEIAALAWFLASDESTLVSAGFFSVDGGATTKRYPDIPGALRRMGAPAAEHT
jgi:NAD(P)-dependent dehydrogenase (short-subunit alcohol dehydrogenase family)